MIFRKHFPLILFFYDRKIPLACFSISGLRMWIAKGSTIDRRNHGARSKKHNNACEYSCTVSPLFRFFFTATTASWIAIANIANPIWKISIRILLYGELFYSYNLIIQGGMLLKIVCSYIVFISPSCL